jgi:exodeoxyribonuclease VII large subunit
MHPENVMKRGYSITLFNGKAITNLEQLKEDDMVETLFIDGSILSEIRSIEKKLMNNE